MIRKGLPSGCKLGKNSVVEIGYKFMTKIGDFMTYFTGDVCEVGG